ncbi:MAG: M28 family peptidase [Planctomycetota bacterium]|nr:M28 family peptidase [Planctomycetota bacterium]
MARFLTFASLFLLLWAPGCASAPNSLEPWVTVEELRAHVEWLADDVREGRRAGSAGERAAASYIAQAFARAGLQPAGDDGTWFQEFEVELAPEAGESALLVDGRLQSGISTLACSKNGRAEGELVSAGYGTVLPSHGMNAFADVNARGKIVLLRRYSEFGPDPAPEFSALGNLRGKIRAAAEAGAIAVVLGTHPEDLLQGGEALIPFDAAPGSMEIPVVTVEPPVFATLEARCAQGESPHAVVEAAVLRPTARARNVLGIVPGGGPELIAVGAHFDHLGWGGDGSLAPGEQAIHNGADDNASGTAVLIELAEEWGGSSVGVNPREVGILFAAWSAEEMGLLGSAHWVKNPTVDLSRVRANVNLDMVGRVAHGAVTVGSAETAAAFRPALGVVSANLSGNQIGLELAIAEGQLPGGGGSDHMSFQQAGIPALFFFSGLHGDYHKPSDDADKLDYEGMLAVAWAVSDLLVQLQLAERASFAYLKPAAPEGGEREVRRAAVWFGSIPDYAASPEGGGMQIAGTSPGSPAEKAGLQPGDVILRVGETAVGDIYDFMDALAGFGNGQTIQVTVKRGEKRLELPLTFFPRPTAGD